MQPFKKSLAVAAQRNLVLAMAAVAVLGVAGCGSNARKGAAPESTRPTYTAPLTPTRESPALTKSAFLARANAICSENNAQLGNVARKAFGNQQPSADQWRTFAVAKVIPLVEARLEAIHALGSPAGSADAVKAILTAGQAAVTTAKRNPRVLTPGTKAPFNRFDQLATVYGLAGCTVGG